MSTTGLIDKMKTFPLEERKAVLKILSEELEEDAPDFRLDGRFDGWPGRISCP